MRITRYEKLSLGCFLHATVPLAISCNEMHLGKITSHSQSTECENFAILKSPTESHSPVPHIQSRNPSQKLEGMCKLVSSEIQ